MHDSSGLPPSFVGSLFGGYRILAPLARGDFSSVFLARKTGPGRFAQTAAIKILHPELAADAARVESFLYEARLASSVNHPNVCRVLDFGEAEGTYYLALEYVRGETWAELLGALAGEAEGRARLTALTAHVLSRACEGLHAIHQARDPGGQPLEMVHGDLSPHNLLVGYDGSVHLLDFGLASARERARSPSAASEPQASARAAADELRGGSLERRAELWALGVMLREALCGRAPGRSERAPAAVLTMRERELPAWPEDVPPALRAIGDGLLAPEPERRFRDARELGAALASYLVAAGETALEAELSRSMHALFAEQLAQKEAPLRASAEMPAATSASAAGANDGDPQAPPARSNVRRGLFVVAAGLMFAASLALSFRAAAPRRTPAEPRAGAELPRERATRAHADAAAGPTRPSGERPSETARGAEPAPAGQDEGRAARRHRTSHRDAARRSSAREATALPAATGTLVIGTNAGWAEVFARGERLGATPLRVQLPYGTHMLEVRPYGTGPARQVAIEVQDAGVTKLHLEL